MQLGWVSKLFCGAGQIQEDLEGHRTAQDTRIDVVVCVFQRNTSAGLPAIAPIFKGMVFVESWYDTVSRLFASPLE